MADLRVGVNIVELQGDSGLTPAARGAVDGMLREVAAHYHRRHEQDPPDALLGAIDRAIGAVTACHAVDIRDPLLHLVGIRRALFPDGRPYAPVPGPDTAPPTLKEAA
jgi:hypothetical protein